MSKLVIVESPTKASTIEKYLPEGYAVRASVGHVRDLPEKASELPESKRKKAWAYLGVDVEGDFDPVYVVKGGRAKKTVAALKKELATADELILATDHDREGEAIGWHLVQVLKPKVPVRRMVFHEITKSAIQEALSQTRDIDLSLVEAQETRRILDRLVGYPLSHLVSKKIKYGLSAGRVQSVAVRLLVQRERERRHFHIATYWDLRGGFEASGSPFQADLQAVDGMTIATGKDFDENTGRLASGKTNVLLLGEAEARDMTQRLQGAPFQVVDVNDSSYKMRPKPPFTTSTLQQEASRKLGYAARETMRLAQALYENGLITYMRTDSTHLSQQAITASRKAAESLFGANFIPDTPRFYKTTSKGAQEAHEAIRPTGDLFVQPAKAGLSGKQARLYELIWMRTVACQMLDAQCTRSRVDLEATVEGKHYRFRANGNRIDFPGYLRAYVAGTDDPETGLENRETILPHMAVGDSVPCASIEPLSHQTKPPARYTEASLVKSLEEHGVGRPSTYATILTKITVDTNYARKKDKALVPTFLAFAVVDLLEKHFSNLVDPAFTARMEDDLDHIASGEGSKVGYLHAFYRAEDGFAKRIETQDKDIKPAEARIVRLEAFPAVMKVGRYGPYVQMEVDGEAKTLNVPATVCPADLDGAMLESMLQSGGDEPRELGPHPESGEMIMVKHGPYGPYVQLGEGGKGKSKPKRSAIPKWMAPDDVDHAVALRLLSLPTKLGTHPEDGKQVYVGLGRFGPYVRHDKEYRSLPSPEKLFEVSLDDAVEILKQPKGRKRGATVLRTLGDHPESGKPIEILEGRYGPYIKFGKKNVSLPKGSDVEAFTMEEAVALIATKVTTPKKAAKKK